MHFRVDLSLVNILFMAPRMVYCSMIYLLWSFICRSEYDVSVRQSEATHVTPVREQGPLLMDQNVELASTNKAPK